MSEWTRFVAENPSFAISAWSAAARFLAGEDPDEEVTDTFELVLVVELRATVERPDGRGPLDERRLRESASVLVVWGRSIECSCSTCSEELYIQQYSCYIAMNPA